VQTGASSFSLSRTVPPSRQMLVLVFDDSLEHGVQRVVVVGFGKHCVHGAKMPLALFGRQHHRGIDRGQQHPDVCTRLGMYARFFEHARDVPPYFRDDVVFSVGLVLQCAVHGRAQHSYSKRDLHTPRCMLYYNYRKDKRRM
jgi:hypothetical protein